MLTCINYLRCMNVAIDETGHQKLIRPQSRNSVLNGIPSGKIGKQILRNLRLTSAREFATCQRPHEYFLASRLLWIRLFLHRRQREVRRVAPGGSNRGGNPPEFRRWRNCVVRPPFLDVSSVKLELSVATCTVTNTNKLAMRWHWPHSNSQLVVHVAQVVNHVVNCTR